MEETILLLTRNRKFNMILLCNINIIIFFNSYIISSYLLYILCMLLHGYLIVIKLLRNWLVIIISLR